ncbi:acyl carrier protein [Paenibacillus lentus]|uniref:Acyl carrier protein n=1 Tax=Paenibacillus lentus TaxID=1338368 RepID=A0A3S8RZY8_9BACL|nr:phosphopantetheine-binding protein [Paenibacillus lentus]AZK48516.1 acyl carrier protein [Paenibacillus lentus]
MNRTMVQEGILEVIHLVLMLPEADIDTELIGSSGILDSMTMIRLLAELEKRFDFTLDEEDLSLDSLRNVRSLTDWIIKSKEGELA